MRFENVNNNLIFSYEDAIKDKEKTLEKINGIIKILQENIVRKNTKPVYNDIYVLEKLKAIYNLSNSIEAKAKSNNTRISLINSINTLIDKIQTAKTFEEPKDEISKTATLLETV